MAHIVACFFIPGVLVLFARLNCRLPVRGLVFASSARTSDLQTVRAGGVFPMLELQKVLLDRLNV